MSDLTETTELGDGHYDQPNEAVKQSVDHAEHEADDPRHIDEHPGDHWTDMQFVYLALFLAAVTAVEVALSYTIDFWGPFFLPTLLALMLVKFFSVVFYFMHLKFDNRWFGLLFYMGLVLAIGVYLAALFTFRFFDA